MSSKSRYMSKKQYGGVFLGVFLGWSINSLMLLWYFKTDINMDKLSALPLLTICSFIIIVIGDLLTYHPLIGDKNKEV